MNTKKPTAQVCDQTARLLIEFGYRAMAEKYRGDPVVLARLDRVREVFLQQVKEKEMLK